MNFNKFYATLPVTEDMVEGKVGDECPICHYRISPKLLETKQINFTDGTNNALFIFACPHCKNIFSAMTSLDIIGLDFTSPGQQRFRYSCYFDKKGSSFTPFSPKIPELPNNLQQNAFSKFQAVYKDTCAADSYGLSQVAGIGYRKCIEFLIKDFLLLISPDKAEEICNPKTPLMNLINKLISDPELQEIAQKTTWLANDETHYTKLHTDKDLNDVRKFFFVILDEVDRHLKIIELKQVSKK